MNKPPPEDVAEYKGDDDYIADLYYIGMYAKNLGWEIKNGRPPSQGCLFRMKDLTDSVFNHYSIQPEGPSDV